jgi:CIC family chloride channel protein
MFTEVVTFALSRKTPLYREQVLSRRESPAHGGETVLDLLQDLTVRDIYHKGESLSVVAPETPVSELLRQASESAQAVFPVRQATGSYTGLVSLDTLRALFVDEELQRFAIAEDCATGFVSVTLDDTLALAMERFASSQYPQLPVMDTKGSTELLGWVNFDDLLSATRREALQRAVNRRTHPPPAS